MAIYLSSSFKELESRVKYFKRHPVKYMKLFEQDFNIKLKWYQKIELFLFNIGVLKTKRQRQHEKLDKLLRKYMR